MLSYYYDFLLFVCVDICYDINKVPYRNSLISDTGRPANEEITFYGNFSSNVCSSCHKKWLQSPLGNAPDYTKFYFYSRESGLNYTQIFPGNVSSLNESGFNSTKATKIIIHGWRDSGLIHFGEIAREAYLNSSDVNIIVLDWSEMAFLFYPLSRAAVDPVGRYLAVLIDWLVAAVGLPPSSLHLAGHSLGAHIAGVAGEHVTTGPLYRITGLDPAGPGFDWQKNGRLDSSDALFVDIIHTCGGVAGYFDPCGHVDFYPNGGVFNQPGCPFDLGKCSHTRSYKLFAESVSHDAFVSRACDDWDDYKRGLCDHNNVAMMGEHVNRSASGKFYLKTAGQYPYALGG